MQLKNTLKQRVRSEISANGQYKCLFVGTVNPGRILFYCNIVTVNTGVHAALPTAHIYRPSLLTLSYL